MLSDSPKMPNGHMYCPPAPVIVFTNGEHYLGEVRGHPLFRDEAQAKLRHHIDILDPGLEGDLKRAMLAYGSCSRLSLGGHIVPGF